MSRRAAPDPRLSLIREMTPLCHTAADIGTDHGYLICALVEQGRAERGIAADINPLPLEKARREAARRGLSHRIDFYLTDGLTGIPREKLGAVIIAGMGGETIIHILESWPHAGEPGITWLLQPMTKAERLREWLWGKGFAIRREECCTAAGRVYTVLEVRYTGEITSPPAWARYLGAVDPARNSHSRRYTEDKAGELEKIAAGLERTGRPEDRTRGQELREAAAVLRQKLREGEISNA